jgi:uncharacterized protein (TIGR03083 family)
MSATPSGSTIDHHALRLDELAALCKTLEPYSDEQWNADSLCEGWRVRDVVGHMLTGYTTPMPTMILKLSKYGFNVPKGSAAESKVTGSAHEPKELLAMLADVQRNDTRKGISKVIPADEGLVDHVIHHIDITRPLGLPTTTSDTNRRAALERVVTLGGFVKAKARAKGLKVSATDLDFTWGSGPEVRGNADDLLLALSGRPLGLEGLEGDGVEVLRGRL